ncbi:MAG: Dyp-type peroxidase [Pseudomonadota bacterium]
MAKPQSGVLPEANKSANLLTLNVAPGEAAAAAVRQAAAGLPNLNDEIAALDPAARLASAIGIGAEAWTRIFGDATPDGLTPFTPFEDGGRSAPATPADLFLHLRAERFDLCFELTRRWAAGLGGAVETIEEVHGFRYLDSRDLTGFVDGTENPKDEHRAEVALVPEGPHAGGSYVDIQRYVHDLATWNRLSVAAQEQIIARTKADNEEFAAEDKPETAHIKRVSIKDDGVSVEILRHSLPYGTMDEHGLYFISYAGRPDSFRRMLERMIVADPAGHYDHLMDYSRAVTGASFFAPSRDWLEAQAD